MENKFRVLVVGDIMIDVYKYVTTTRKAPETNIPVWDISREERRLGGAANVANNLVAIGENEVEVYLAGIISSKEKPLCDKHVDNTFMCVDGQTMFKERYVDESTSKIIFRCDSFNKFSAIYTNRFSDVVKHLMYWKNFDAVIFSDYDKGTITDNVVHNLSACPLIVIDSKRQDLSVFEDARKQPVENKVLLKINELEYSTQVSYLSNTPKMCLESMFSNVIVTRGKKGSEIRTGVLNDDKSYRVDVEKFTVPKVNVRDVTGCGDTHTAALTFSLLKNKDMRMAVNFANMCSVNVVQKFGTSVVSKQEVL